MGTRGTLEGSTARQRPSILRRQLLLAGSAWLAAGMALPGAARATATARIGLTPVFLLSDLELLASLERYLAGRLGIGVDLVTRRSYQEITALLLSGQLDAAWICGYPYIRNRDRLELIAVPLWPGRPLYQAYLLAAAEGAGQSGAGAAAEDLAGLRGGIHAFSDPDSNSGFLVTQALLAGLSETPSSFFSRTFFTYGHRNVVRAVANGLADSGSVDGYVWEVMDELEPAMTARTRIVRRSEWLGFPPLVVPRARRDAALSEAIDTVFRAMHEDAEGRSLLQVLRLDGFAEAEDALFDAIAAKYDAVRSLG